MIAPKTKIRISGNKVKMVISCAYPAQKNRNTADEVWAIVSDFPNVKTIFPTLIRNYITYPDDTQERVGTIRDMTFAGNPPSIGIEKLLSLNDSKRTLQYTSLEGLPVSNYLGTMKVTGMNQCTLTWTISYTQKPPQKKFAKFLAGLFASGEKEIANVIGVK